MPYQTLFPGQEPDEKIIMVLRRHWWILFKIVFSYGMLSLLPLFFRYIIINYSNLLDSETALIILNLSLSLYYIFVLTFFFRSWLDYYLDVWVITSKRIVNIEQKGLFSRQISTQRLYRIQDVTAEVKGILPTFLHYGNVHIQTAGPMPRFIFKQIPNPYEVTRKIMTLVNWKKRVLAKQGIIKGA